MGPPPPRVLSAATRALQLAVLAAMLAWVLGPLGGLSLSPRPVPGGAAGANDTSQLFNWHPLLLTLAFPVLMAEAVLAYQAPLLALKDRCARGVTRAAAGDGEGTTENEARQAQRSCCCLIKYTVCVLLLQAPSTCSCPPPSGRPPSSTTSHCTRQRLPAWREAWPPRSEGATEEGRLRGERC